MRQALPKKVVLLASRPYTDSDAPMLLALIRRPIALFCAAGVDCTGWEDAFDWLLTDPLAEGSPHISTTSHPEERLAEVMAFAGAWPIDETNSVELIEVHAQVK
ncbi:hypothetical protein [Inhella crocodyli]|uniref:Uncharacterized protein n=1 Tax=Inhella crocodyli TaxID=2499851 RepID=A0A3S3T570_9BURK|nr:hypothetical protein [Inhella crocodyli]RVT83616.1 hypothetical protein EOD73_13625 [Inhella crocodyli]